MDKAIIEKVQSFGFDVYMRNPSDTWLYFTDGTRIGYLEDGRYGFNLSTVHKPNKQSGDGFQVERDAGDFTAEMLAACFVTAPAWAARWDRDSVVKYRDMAEFIGRDSFNRGCNMVPKPVPAQ